MSLPKPNPEVVIDAGEPGNDAHRRAGLWKGRPRPDVEVQGHEGVTEWVTVRWGCACGKQGYRSVPVRGVRDTDRQAALRVAKRGAAQGHRNHKRKVEERSTAIADGDGVLQASA